jgi:hypothetical protein
LVELIAVPPETVTEIGPADAAAGTVALICVVELTAKPALAPLNATLLAPVKPEPEIVTLAPIVPELGLKPEIVCASADAVRTDAATAHPMITTSHLHLGKRIIDMSLRASVGPRASRWDVVGASGAEPRATRIRRRR